MGLASLFSSSTSLPGVWMEDQGFQDAVGPATLRRRGGVAVALRLSGVLDTLSPPRGQL